MGLSRHGDDVLVGSAVKPGSFAGPRASLSTHRNLLRLRPVRRQRLPLRPRSDNRQAAAGRTRRGPDPQPDARHRRRPRCTSSKAATPPRSQPRSGRAKLGDLLARAPLVALDLATGKVVWEKSPKELPAVAAQRLRPSSQDRLVSSARATAARTKRTTPCATTSTSTTRRPANARWTQSQRHRPQIGGDHGEQDQHPVDRRRQALLRAVRLRPAHRQPARLEMALGQKAAAAAAATSPRRPRPSSSATTRGTFDLEEGEVSTSDDGNPPRLLDQRHPGRRPGLAPEASSGCTCNFAVQTSLALIPVRKK